MRSPLRVLILEDRVEDAEIMLHELRRSGFEPSWERVDNDADFTDRLSQPLEVILADYSLPQYDANHALQRLRESGSDIPFIVVTGSVGEEAAVECMKRGAADYLLKDRLARLGQAVSHALEQKRLRDEKRRAEVERERLIDELQSALAKVRKLTGLIPICASCKRIRDDKGYWDQVEVYIQEHSDARFSHGLCPDCSEKLFPDYFPAKH